MEKFFLTSISADEFWARIKGIVSEVTQESTPVPTAQSEEQRFTINGLAGYLNCTRATIHAYKKRGVFPFYQTGRTIYFKKAEVDAALSNTKKSTIKK